ncbi:MAG: hypothetical protein HW407_583 [Bacteroidetes bacterium]|nr:hypothetical protein [Bacteroidota bacterium]
MTRNDNMVTPPRSGDPDRERRGKRDSTSTSPKRKPGINPGVDHTFTLCLRVSVVFFCLERETGLEPATSSLGSWHSTTELLPHNLLTINFVRGTIWKKLAFGLYPAGGGD